MSISEKVDAFIEKQEQWREELIRIRAVFNNTELTEAVKWGAPAYLYKKKTIAGMMGFKNHLGIWFHQGVFLKDTENKLINAQDGKTKALRQWRIYKGETIATEILKDYILEAIQNCKEGKEFKPTPKAVKFPELLQNALQNDLHLSNSFDALTPGKQKEYMEYIAEAKLEATKLRRLEKITPLILKGEGLHDKYKNC